MQYSLNISSSYFLHGFGCWFWHTHTHMCTSFFDRQWHSSEFHRQRCLYRNAYRALKI
jgi:hypothetical protein